MATLILSVVGSAIGGPVGGALGAAIGQQIDQNILFKPKGREGPRLKELAVQTSSYGTQIPRIYGRMRVAGTVIWAADIKETKNTSGGGKRRPKVTNYSYSACFAVALSSRRISKIGRIWADGKIFRGRAGDFKTTTSFRFYQGHEDQPADSLLSAAEASAKTPAYRGVAIAVFEDMDLTDYGNRIPSLTFEVIADDGSTSLTEIVDDISGHRIDLSSAESVFGYAASGSDRRAALMPIIENFLLSFTTVGFNISAVSRFGKAQRRFHMIDGEVVRAMGRKDIGVPEVQIFPERKYPQQLALRYYEPKRDYQSGLQNAFRPGHGRMIENRELPAAVSASRAKAVAQAAIWTGFHERASIRLHIAHGSRNMMPGAIFQLPDGSGFWRIRHWELKNGAAELSGSKVSPISAPLLPHADEGRAVSDPDVAAGATRLVMVDLPFALDKPTAPATSGQLYAAAAGKRGWRNADLYRAKADGSAGQFIDRISVPATIGTADQALDGSNPYIFDRKNMVEITLHNRAMKLHDANQEQLLVGKNIALLGKELIQFSSATPLGNSRYRLSQFIRGLAGTEHQISTHKAGESFVLIEAIGLTAVDPQYYSPFQPAKFLALGRGDRVAVEATALSPGIALLPWSPVHPNISFNAESALNISWTRRSRAGLLWLDGVDVPLAEEVERYFITLRDRQNRLLSETKVNRPTYSLSKSKIDRLQSAGVDKINFSIRQVGRFGMSKPLLYFHLF